MKLKFLTLLIINIATLYFCYNIANSAFPTDLNEPVKLDLFLIAVVWCAGVFGFQKQIYDYL